MYCKAWAAQGAETHHCEKEFHGNETVHQDGDFKW
jgi:hypothetical protein